MVHFAAAVNFGSFLHLKERHALIAAFEKELPGAFMLYPETCDNGAILLASPYIYLTHPFLPGGRRLHSFATH